MRFVVLVGLAMTAFCATMTYDATDANAIVCARESSAPGASRLVALPSWLVRLPLAGISW